jgi:NSS family neurotransmitter:Na+ symporter
MASRDQFRSRIGFILAAAGSAIGLGNIWRFPYMTGASGGGAFVLMYLLIVMVVGVSLLLVEFSIGRHGKANAVDSYAKIHKGFAWIGYLGVFTSFLLISYYSVVGGWTIYYTLKSATGTLTSLPADQIGNFFGGFISQPVLPLFYHLLFIFLTAWIVAKGISGGIEKYTKALMPLLFIMLLILLVRALTLPGAMKGVAWYLKPDFSKLTGSTVVAACGQVFFSLSLGLSGMVTYASYLSKDDNLISSSFVVAMTDTLIAIIAGFVIFPTIFAFGGDPSGGPGLVFISLPQIFTKMPMGAFFAFIFFLLLVIAALTSSISIMEVCITFFVEKVKWSRLKASVFYGTVCFLLGIPVSLSFGMWGDVKILGKGIFDLFDYFCSNISLPLSGLACAILVGWFWGKEKALAEVTNDGRIQSNVAGLWFFTVKYVIPIVVGIIFLQAIGVLQV